MESEVAEMTTKYETEKKEAELTRQNLIIQKQKNTRNLILFVGILILGLIGLVAQYFTNQSKKEKRQAEMALHLEQERAIDLADMNQTKDNLFNNVSHELRTPLTMIIGPLEEALKSVRHVEVKRDVTLALDNSKRLHNLVNEILDLSKLDAKKLSVHTQSVNLFTLITRIYSSFSSLAQVRGIEMQHNLDKGRLSDFQIMIDAAKLETIMNNLISNAIKFSGRGDCVRLMLDYSKLKQSNLVVSIHDEGSGISVEDQVRVFDRYFQASSQKHSAGTGIGLALTKELVELMEGDISVDSELGEGSTFSFRLPFVLAPAIEPLNDWKTLGEESTSDLEGLILPFANKPNILVVEDDISMVNYLESLLKEKYHITKAYNGREAMALLKKAEFDLISSDVMMPEMDGFTFRERINKDPRIRNTPFIMLTARNLEEDKLKGLRLGVDDYLTKPFSPNELRARIHNLVKNKKSRAELLTDEVNPDEQLVDQAMKYVKMNLNNENLKTGDLANYLNYSSRQVNRILKRTIGLSAVELILEVRLQQAYELIRARSFGTINEIRMHCGISSSSYFTTKFKERFGINPSQII